MIHLTLSKKAKSLRLPYFPASAKLISLKDEVIFAFFAEDIAWFIIDLLGADDVALVGCCCTAGCAAGNSCRIFAGFLGSSRDLLTSYKSLQNTPSSIKLKKNQKSQLIVNFSVVKSVLVEP